MEVTKPDAITPVGQGGREPPRQRHEDDHTADDEEQPRERRWSDDDAVAVAGLAAAMTPELMEAFQALSSQLEPLRRRLKVAEREARENKELAARHDVLALPNRREFMRELAHVLDHMGDLSTPPSVMVVHVAGTEAVRLRHGRAALDEVLTGAAEALAGALHPTDVLGSLGGADFGVILLIGDARAAAAKAEDLAAAVAAGPLAVGEDRVHLTARVGIAVLDPGMTAAAAVAQADADLVAAAG